MGGNRRERARMRKTYRKRQRGRGGGETLGRADGEFDSDLMFENQTGHLNTKKTSKS